jgi:nucleotide-binding universal stress UspA family protein
MTGITRILVPTDFSATSDAALTYAKRLAERFDASLHLVHAFEDPFTTAAFAAEAYTTLPLALREQLVLDAEARLTDRLSTDERIRFNGTAEIVTGTPSAAIVDYARTLGIDLIVMGTHGRGGMAHVLLGSVAERVVRTAHCPVLTLRDRPNRAIQHILVPTDFSATADAALDYAFALAARFGADVQLLHVLDDPFLAEGMTAEAYIAEAPTVRTAMLRDAQTRLTHRAVPPSADVTVYSEVLFGHNAKTIAEYAAMRNIDVIVMGTHGRTGVAHLLLGSVAERLVRTAPCPVFTVRQTPTAKAYAELVYDVDHLPA